MSSFVTKLPVDLAALKSLLPADAFVEGVKWNGAEVELRWSYRELVTPLTGHTDYPVEALKGKKLPPGVRYQKFALRMEGDSLKAGLRTPEHVRTPGGKAVAVRPKQSKGEAA